jgi:hypothetical protein
MDVGFQVLFDGFAFGFLVLLVTEMGLGVMTWFRRFLGR